jgi:glycosyltransferase involved in cell wall biosynthesis
MLSIVVPVWNDSVGLARLLPSLLLLPHLARIIVVDDCSDTLVSPLTLNLSHLEGEDRVLWLRSDVQSGAGHARNFGLAHVNTSHVMYLDSDDTILPDLAPLITELLASSAEAFDFCLFRHVESRQRSKGQPGPLPLDQFHWDIAGIGGGLHGLTMAQVTRLCRVSAYPWNKIYRTAFLKENGILCTEIPIHNDVELHWRSFFHARRICASDRLCIEHFVHEAGSRLTNRRSSNRLRVFEALEVLRQECEDDVNLMITFGDALIEFYLNLFRWIEKRLDDDEKFFLRDRATGFLLSSINKLAFRLLASKDPVLAGRVNDFLERGVL